MDIDIIPFEGFDESFGHAIGFGASDWSKTTDEAHILRKSSRFCGGIATAIVAEPFHRMREPGNSRSAAQRIRSSGRAPSRR